MSKYVFSTLASGVLYTEWTKTANDMHIKGREVHIAGGAGVASQGTKAALHTPQGVVTEVSDDDYAFLQKNDVFKLHVKNGHIKVLDKHADAEKVAADMNRNDPSAPKTPNSPEMQNEPIAA